MCEKSDGPLGTLLRLPHFSDERLAFYKAIGLSCIQVAGVVDEYLGGNAGAVKSDHLMGMLEQAGLAAESMFLSFADMKWTPDEVGVIPLHHRAERMVQACRQMNWGRRYGIRTIVCHAGYFPLPGSSGREALLADLRRLVSFAADNGQEFLFETAHESAGQMEAVFAELDMPNAGMNFDPANALYYDQDEPMIFMERLFPYIRGMHCKDGARPEAGESHGHETVLGEGDVHFPELLSRMLAKGYSCPLIIERELPPGPEQEKDIQNAVQLIQQIVNKAKETEK